MKKLLFNPFENYTETQLVLSGLAITLIGSFLGMQFEARFDGLLDLHFSESVGFYPFLDNLIAIACSVVVLFVLGYRLNKKTRIIDILGASMIARIPMYLLTFFNAGNLMGSITERLMQSTSPADIDAISASDLLTLLAFSMLGLVFLIWFFILLWNGFKVATNARGTTHIVYFVIAIVAGEILSKLIFLLL